MAIFRSNALVCSLTYLHPIAVSICSPGPLHVVLGGFLAHFLLLDSQKDFRFHLAAPPLTPKVAFTGITNIILPPITVQPHDGTTFRLRRCLTVLTYICGTVKKNGVTTGFIRLDLCTGYAQYDYRDTEQSSRMCSVSGVKTYFW